MGKYPNVFYEKQSSLDSSVDECKHKIRTLTLEERFGVLYNPKFLTEEQLTKLQSSTGRISGTDDIDGTRKPGYGGMRAGPVPLMPVAFVPRARRQQNRATNPDGSGNLEVPIIPANKHTTFLKTGSQTTNSDRVKYSKEELLNLRHRSTMIFTRHPRQLPICRCWNRTQYSAGQLLALRQDESFLKHKHLPCCKEFKPYRPRFGSGSESINGNYTRSY